MADSQNITWPIVSGVLAVLNVIFGFIVFPMKKQVDENTRDLSHCQRTHSAQLEGTNRDITYIKRDASKAEATAAAFATLMGEVKEEVSKVKFATDANSSSIKELKSLVDNLPDRIASKIKTG